MTDTRAPAHVVAFGNFEADLQSRELRKRGVRIALQEQPFRVLARLLQQPGTLVTREELHHQLWADNTFLDFEHGLNAAIKRLRDALGDTADTPRFIETLPRRGYRFIAPVVPRDVEGAAVTSTTLEPGTSSSRRAKWVAVALALLAAVAGTVWWTRVAGQLPPASADGASPATPATITQRVAIGRFENRSGDAALDPLAARVPARLTHAVAQVPDVEVVASQDGAAVLVNGALFADGDAIEFHGRIHQQPGGRLLHALPAITAQRDSVDDAVAALERRVAGAIAIHYDDFFGGLDVVSHVPDIDAYREYRAGLELFDADYPRALAHLQRAVELDPSFWLPRVLMHFARGNMGQPDAMTAELAEIERARAGMTSAERLLADYLRVSGERRSSEALRVLRDLERLAPTSLLVNHNIVEQSLASNRPRAAVQAYDRLTMDVRRMRHSVGRYRMILVARALHQLSEYDRELEVSRQGRQLVPGVLAFAVSEVRALAAMGRADEVEAVAERSLSVPATSGSPGQVLIEAALELRAHGHRDQSMAMAERAVEWHQTRGDDMARLIPNRGALADALYLAERWADAEAAYVALARAVPGHPGFAGSIGACAARRGQLARARQIADGLTPQEGVYPLGLHTYWRARIASLAGERDRAVDLLRDAIAQGLGNQLLIHSTPDFESLRDYPPFVQLMAPEDAAVDAPGT